MYKLFGFFAAALSNMRFLLLCFNNALTVVWVPVFCVCSVQCYVLHLLLILTSLLHYKYKIACAIRTFVLSFAII